MDIKLSRGMNVNSQEAISEVLFMMKEIALFRLNHHNYGLVLDRQIANKMINAEGKLFEFIKNKFVEFQDELLFVGKPGYKIFSVLKGPYGKNYDELKSFCHRLKSTFEQLTINKVSDIIYIEEFDIMLPIIYYNYPTYDKEEILSKWLADGIDLTFLNVEQLIKVNNNLNEEVLINLMNESGIVKDILPTLKEEDKNNGNVFNKKIAPFILYGRDDLTTYFNEQIIDFIINMDKYEKMGIRSVPATLLYGMPGCGKTYAVNKLAEYLNLPIFEIDSGSIASPYVHDTSKKINEVFEKAMDAAPSILIIDEVESYLSSRGDAGTETYRIEEVNEFLRNIPKAIDSKVIIFGMTNMLNLLDPAVLRKGRFDNIIEIGMPTEKEVSDVLNEAIKDIPKDDKLDLGKVIKSLLGRSLSDIAYVVREAIRYAVRQDCRELKQEHLNQAIHKLGDSKNSQRRKIGF